jgi:hypothetical protein
MLPGDYTIAVLLYESEQKQSTVLLKKIHVPAIEHDSLPEMTRNLRRVEFLAEPDKDALPLGQGELLLPVPTTHPVEVDILFDAGAPFSSRRSTIAHLVASQQMLAANVLSQIVPSTGCVHVSALDVLRQETLFERQNAEDFDWPKRREAVLKRNLDTVDISKLGSKNQSGVFFRDAVQRILSAKPLCAGAAAPQRFVIVLTSGVMFPWNTPTPPVSSTGENVHLIYLRLGSYSILRNNRYGGSDDLPKTLRQLTVEKHFAGDPVRFRQLVRHFMDEIAAAGK